MRCLALVLLATFLFPLAALAGPATPSSEGIYRLEGAAIYRDKCLECHGDNGNGRTTATLSMDTPPPDFTRPAAVVSLTRERMLASVQGGHSVDTAPTWDGTLDDESAAKVIAFLQDAFMMPAATADASLGRRLYAHTCSVCHGERGDAASWAQRSLNPPPFNFTGYKAKRLSRRHMINTVTYGRDNTAMVGFASQLSREEIAAVVDFIRRTFIFPGLADSSPNSGTQMAATPGTGNAGHGHDDDLGPGVAADMSEPIPGGLTGDPKRGRALYDINCADCHGEEGKGDGRRAYFIFPKPENFADKRARAELNRPHLFSGIYNGITGTVMPAWSKVLNEQDIADITEYVFTAFIRPRDPAGPDWQPTPKASSSDDAKPHDARDAGKDGTGGDERPDAPMAPGATTESKKKS